MRFRITYEYVKKHMRFDDICIEADDVTEARVLAKYRIERSTDNAFRVKAVAMEAD